MKLHTVLIAGAACAMATAAFAQSGSPALRSDANGDGKIDKAEYIADAKTMLDRYDSNKDGKITIAEGGPVGEVNRALIATHGEDYAAITLAALQADREASFDTLDTDKDGFLSREEMTARFRQVRETMADGKVDKAERLAQARAQFERMDTDKDGREGRFTLAEFLANSAATFDESDTNKDGFITSDEAKAANLAAIARRAQQGQ